METIASYDHNGSTTIANGATVSAAVSCPGFTRGAFLIPTGWSGGASVSFQVADAIDGTFAALYDSANALVSQNVTQTRWYAFPDAVLKARAFKIVAVGATGANETILYVLKG